MFDKNKDNEELFSSTYCSGISLNKIFELMITWSRYVIDHKESFYQVIDNDKESKALMFALTNSITEIGFMSANFQHLVIRITNTIKTLNNTMEILSKKYGKVFSESVPPIPVSLFCSVVDNKDLEQN